ncbi:ABC transporter permease [Psychrobacillus glaciei]|uniref:ABC transporter permease n=1 Tax=Psychrobacillus glaciei TaxID=2283160 RepID=A0A5J6SNX0_9BACI|nr:ABC transporter permease [Psychrobacillus glaciei]QFF97847.1 ABC transporter permease [Psychrobacillus glaciei]
MIGIIAAKFQLFLRKPATFIIMTAISIAFAYMVGLSGQGKIEIPVYTALTNSEELVEHLNKSENFLFVKATKEEAEKEVREGQTVAAVQLSEEGYTIIHASDETSIPLINNELRLVYAKMLENKSILAQADKPDKVKAVLMEAEESPVFQVKQYNFKNDKEIVYDSRLYSLFGFSLYFVMYTIANNVYPIMEEKHNRIWDRLILSSVNKWEIYAGNLLFSFLIGYIQIVVIFCTFRYVAGVDFYGGFAKTFIVLIPYVLAIVALCILLASLAGSAGKYMSYLTITSVPLAMLGGAYWPLEIVTSKVMLFLAKITPVNYGMQLLNGATVNGYSYSELLEPMSILLLMAVIMMGIGINIIEKRNT